LSNGRLGRRSAESSSSLTRSPAFYDYIRIDQFGEENVSVISDRRRIERRYRSEGHVPERRRDERRRYDIELQLRTQGWAEVRLPEG